MGGVAVLKGVQNADRVAVGGGQAINRVCRFAPPKQAVILYRSTGYAEVVQLALDIKGGLELIIARDEYGVILIQRITVDVLGGKTEAEQ